MKPHNTVRNAVQRALCVGAFASAASYAPAALAQGADGETLEEITVTGTRIQRQDYASASPISTVDAQQFLDTGAPTIETVLNSLPQFVPALTSTSNNPDNGGQANVALRGLGTTRTLVLLDGRRITPSNATGVVDLNLIPASIIQNVEIITGGASAVYGSDAVAGVVNIRTREFTGLEFTGGYGLTDRDDGERTNFGITGGMDLADGRGYMFGSFNWADREGVVQGDRPFSEVAVDWNDDLQAFEPLGSATIRQGRWDALTSNLPSQAALDAYFTARDPSYVPGTAAPGNNYGFNPDGSLFNTSPVVNFTGDRNEPQQPVNDLEYTYNYAPPNYLELPMERKSFFGKAGFDVNDTTELFAQVLWGDYDVDLALAPTPASQLYINADNPNIEPGFAGLLASRPNPAEPFRYRKRMTESGPRISANSYEVIQMTAGMTGELSFLDGWDWDLYASWGEVEQEESQQGNVSRSAFEQLSLAADHGASVCGQAINPFGIGSLATDDNCFVDFYTRSAINNTSVQQRVAEGFVTGPMFEMPAGDAQLAAGLLYKNDNYAFLADPTLTATSIDPVTGASRTDIVGFNAQDNVRGSTTSREAYLEASFPLLGDMALAQLLDLTVGYRYADHNIVGTMNSYKGELSWDINNAFRVRGGYQRAVRAPNIDELFSPATINFPSVGLGDPCSNDFTDPDGEVAGAPDSQQARDLCVAQGIPAATLDQYLFTNTQFQGLDGGNPELREETADTITLGLVYQGSGEGFLGAFSGSIDAYQIEIEDGISEIPAQTFVERCFSPAFNAGLSNDNQFCNLFTRDPGTGEIVDALEVQQNLAKFEIRGIDFQLDYTQDLGPGQANAKLVASNLIDWERAITAADPLEQFAGTAADDFDILPEWKSVLSVGYLWNSFDANLRWRYVGETNDKSFPDFKLKAINYYDLTLGYDFTNFNNALAGLRVRGGITNLTDEDPLIYPSQQQANTDPATYDVLGRRWFLNLTYTF